jgi:putative transposase
MSTYKHKSHNVSILMYHIVCPAKYRRMIFSAEVDAELKRICLEISERYEIDFLEIGTDKDHVHFLVQSVPMYSPTSIVKKIKSITAIKLFERHPEIKKQLWGGQLWSKGYYISTVGKHGDGFKIGQYVKNQGLSDYYKVLHKQSPSARQKSLWD